MDGCFVDIEKARARGSSVLVAMSGGVDSAVAALLVHRAGFRAIGITMKNYCFGQADQPDRSCCSIEAVEDARRECDRLGIPHRVADVEAFFKRAVIDNFVSEYATARTPNPCVRCNSIVRFRTLIEHAERLGIDYVATGHYARVFETHGGRRYLGRSTNRRKDQSYFLSGVHGAQLERVIFPLGGYEKETVREMAGHAKMPVADKEESQEVCFVPEGTLRGFLESRDVPLTPGPIERTNGEVIGRHEGLPPYTVGQRRHIGVSAPRPHYVVAMDRERNALIVGEADALLRRELTCTLHWIDEALAGRPDELIAQIRYRHVGVPIERVDIDGRRARVVFAEPQRAVCPGQTLAFYRGDLVVGSGVIDGPVSP